MGVVTIVGAGLAGSEAALQLASRGFRVRLFEMRPGVMTEAHSTGLPAELVCSNSLRSDLIRNAPGLLKEELRRCGSFLMEAADQCRVPAGGALAVDRTLFSRAVLKMLEDEPDIELIREELTEIPEGRVIIAAGPLASTRLTETVSSLTKGESLYFYDAIAPVVSGDSINMEKAFYQSRYSDSGETDYLNCPMTEDEYRAFVQELLSAERVQPRDFEKEIHFQGCMPVEAIADSGEMSLAFGPMKPVGLTDPSTGQRPFAVVQLRREDNMGTAWNLVGFQTKLTYSGQKRIFRTIPGLEEAEFVRLGSMHRNTFINGPALLDQRLRLKTNPEVSFAGQITGVEGYIESIGSGFLAGILAAGACTRPSETTALGALLRYATERDVCGYQPSNINYSLFPPLGKRVRGGRKAKREAFAERALEEIETWFSTLSFSPGLEDKHRS